MLLLVRPSLKYQESPCQGADMNITGLHDESLMDRCVITSFARGILITLLAAPCPALRAETRPVQLPDRSPGCLLSSQGDLVDRVLAWIDVYPPLTV